jgi:exopolysaccharide/PEP-CTERM locus tyrosine autokinase
VSKLQTAINKITAGTGDGRVSGRRKRPPERPPNIDPGSSGSLNDAPVIKESIVVDRDILAAEGILIAGEESAVLRDEMRRIKWPVLENAFGPQRDIIPRGNVVMVTSALAGEGKTFTTINLAMSIAAERDIDVLLIDADIAKPHVSKVFGLDERPGVIDYLAGDLDSISDVIFGTDIPGLAVLPAGRHDEHASELIASATMSDFVSELNDRFARTIILFDTSPLLETNESQVLLRLAGQVLFVVAASKAPQPAVQEAVDLLGEDAVVNVIFNRVRSLLKQKYRYGGYYGYRSRR